MGVGKGVGEYIEPSTSMFPLVKYEIVDAYFVLSFSSQRT